MNGFCESSVTEHLFDKQTEKYKQWRNDTIIIESNKGKKNFLAHCDGKKWLPLKKKCDSHRERDKVVGEIKWWKDERMGESQGRKEKMRTGKKQRLLANGHSWSRDAKCW
jgi:hypothetical protein